MSGLSLGLAAMDALLADENRYRRSYSYSPLVIDLRRGLEMIDTLVDPHAEIRALRRDLRRRRKRVFPIGPTAKRAKVKAARKANVRRMQRPATLPPKDHQP